MITLENDAIVVTIAKKGAELQSLKSKRTGLSYLWSGDPAFWGKHSPILFPIVGALKGGAYEYDGHTYPLSRHGFARDHEFEVDQISDSEILFSLSFSEETLKVYPFEFTLGVRYKILDDNLTCAYEVLNLGIKPLLFSIGGHPAFAAPLQSEISYSDCYLEFNGDHELTYHKIKDDLIDNETKTVRLTANKLDLKHELFYDDALVFKNLKSTMISLKNHKTPNGLHFYFHNFPFFGIWAAKDADFVCLEPWCGIADGINHNQQLREKEGIVSLSSKKLWQRKWGIEAF